MERLLDLFATTAQVSFSIAGLLFVALSINEQRMKRWFDKKNVTFVGLSFLMVVLPGFISLLGLIPDITTGFLAFVSLLSYGLVLASWWIKNDGASKETRAERSKWKWLQKIWDIKGDVIVICLGWILILFMAPPQVFYIIGAIIVVAVILSTFSIFSLFRNS